MPELREALGADHTKVGKGVVLVRCFAGGVPLVRKHFAPGDERAAIQKYAVDGMINVES
jgi:hypothetical protein